MLKPITIFIFFLSISTYALENKETSLKEFETDFCTMFKEGTKESPDLWKHCCIKHDLAYWVAGDKSDMKKADMELKSCVEKTGEPFIAQLMYSGIRLGHLSPVKNKFSWGWAHSSNREKYKKLSAKEREEISLRILEIDNIESELLIEFLDFRFP